MRKTHYWIIAIVAALTGAFVWLPGYVESSMNGALHKPPDQISTRARDLQSRIPIVDLHDDSLPWPRDLLVRGARCPRGHVDIPRLIEGHVALQAFTVVTKTPRGLNLDRKSTRLNS